MTTAIDKMINTDDVRYQQFVRDVGPLQASHMLKQHNSACVLLDGFEQMCRDRVGLIGSFLAPLDNMSIILN